MVETIVPSNNVTEETLSPYCTIYRMTGSPEDGASTVYTLFSGVTITYNDFHTKGCMSNLRYTAQVISIDYCAEGRIEWEHDDGSFCYLWEHDIQISAKADHLNRYGFPTSHYHGITVNFFLPEAKTSLKKAFAAIPVDLDLLWHRLCTKKDVFIMHSERTIQKIFSDLYGHRDHIALDYLRLKIMELLLFITKMETNHIEVEKPYFRRSHVKKIREIKEYLCDNADKKITLSGLSEDFEISLSALQACFKCMYGQSLNAFLKQYRLQKASDLLRRSERSVTEIALETGYENPSKFISAFKSAFGITPLKYRKQNNQMEYF